MPRPYRDYVAAALIDSRDGTPVLKSAGSSVGPSPRSDNDDRDLIVPDGLRVVRCPPGAAIGAHSYAGLGGADLYGRGRRVGGSRADY